jgi:hypothetical protein
MSDGPCLTATRTRSRPDGYSETVTWDCSRGEHDDGPHRTAAGAN